MVSTDYKAFLAFLVTQGYTGQVNEGWYAYLKSQGYTGQINEMAYKFLTDLGYTQATLPEKLKAWVDADLMVTPPLPIEVSQISTFTFFEPSEQHVSQMSTFAFFEPV